MLVSSVSWLPWVTMTTIYEARCSPTPLPVRMYDITCTCTKLAMSIYMYVRVHNVMIYIFDSRLLHWHMKSLKFKLQRADRCHEWTLPYLKCFRNYQESILSTASRQDLVKFALPRAYYHSWLSIKLVVSLLSETAWYRIAGYFRGVYISWISREHSQSAKI